MKKNHFLHHKMASSERICAGCRQQIPDRLFLMCCLCEQIYDIECANVSEKRFMNTMTVEHKKHWKCPLCCSKTPKQSNLNTPIRQNCEEKDSDINFCQTNVNARQKRRHAISPVCDESISSLQGHTVVLEDSSEVLNLQNIIIPTTTHLPSTVDEKILHHINVIIQQNLQQNNESIVLAIRTTIQKEIENALKNLKLEMKQNMDHIQTKHDSIEANIHSLEQKIKLLQSEWAKLREETVELRQEIQNLKLNDLPRVENSEESNRKSIVLHGLNLNYWESEDELIQRVSYIFHDILNINMQQYIEEITYTAKKWYRGPLKIELSSKRMRKYILENSMYFREAGLSVSEYLSDTALKERRRLKEVLLIARKNGQHAIIRNNKLIVNGKESNENYITPRNGSYYESINNTTINQTQPYENQNINLPNVYESIQRHSAKNKTHSFRT